MPHLIIRGIPVEQVKYMSTSLIRELADICDCGTDNFTLEVPNSTFVFDGKEVPCYPLIEVKWFERGQEIRDRFAQAVTNHVLSNFSEVEVAFSAYTEDVYYINGSRCDK